MEPSEIQKLANLAMLDINEETAKETASSITDVLALIDQLQAADTDGVAPMAHPLDAVQVLRADNITESDQRDTLMTVAPQTDSGLFLVPKVVE